MMTLPCHQGDSCSIAFITTYTSLVNGRSGKPKAFNSYGCGKESWPDQIVSP